MNDHKSLFVAFAVILASILLVLVATTRSGTMTNSYPTGRPNAYALTGGPGDQILDWASEVEDILEGTTAIPAYKTGIITDSNTALTAADSGSTVVLEAYGDETNWKVSLPSAAAGLQYTFVDANATAGKDLWFTAASGDTINGGTAGKSYKCTGDAVKQHVTIIAADSTDWYIIAENGTWANDNN